MTREWKPGAIVRATVRGVPDVLVTRDGPGWMTTDGKDWAGDECVTDHRPQIVLDPADPDVAKVLEGVWSPSSYRALADKMRAQIEPPAPPKPDEPLLLAAVVVDGNGTRWTRIEAQATERSTNPWWPADSEDQPAEWSEINAVTVLSEGIA